MTDETQVNPIREIIVDILESKYDGVTFSDAIVESIEKKVAPAIRMQTEEITTDFITDFFLKSKPTRKPRVSRKKASVVPAKEDVSQPESTSPEVKDPTLPTPPVL